jgi:16S rRNA C967 or C1407 C5-methylase (RsmB/RsmF family)
MVRQFLEKYPDFIVEKGPESLSVFQTEDGFYKTIPFRHEMDGMFAARMKKR